MPNIHQFQVASADDDIGEEWASASRLNGTFAGGWRIELPGRRKRISLSDAEEADESTRNRSGAFNGFAALAP